MLDESAWRRRNSMVRRQSQRINLTRRRSSKLRSGIPVAASEVAHLEPSSVYPQRVKAGRMAAGPIPS